jgi:DNA-directed RNA polymerase subunit E'/Rpb7
MESDYHNKADFELVKIYNSINDSQKLGFSCLGEIENLRTEFERRKLNYNKITNSKGEIIIVPDGIYLVENKLFLVNEFILGIYNGEVILGEVIYRSRLCLKVRILAPFIFWENSIGIPNQALGTDNHFWTLKGNQLVQKYGLELLIESYKKLKIIDKNIDDVAIRYGRLEKEINLFENKYVDGKKNEFITAIESCFYKNIDKDYGLNLSCYEKEQFESIMDDYKNTKRKKYLSS